MVKEKMVRPHRAIQLEPLKGEKGICYRLTWENIQDMLLRVEFFILWNVNVCLEKNLTAFLSYVGL